MTLFGKDKWLVCFVGADESKIIQADITRFSEESGVAKPKIDFAVMKCEKLKEIKNVRSEANELYECLVDVLFNLLVAEKKKCRALNVAVVLQRAAFDDDDVYVFATKTLLSELRDHLYVACYKKDFLDTEKRLECYKTPCFECPQQLECRHSCRVSLIWHLFGEDERVIEYFKKYGDEFC